MPDKFTFQVFEGHRFWDLRRTRNMMNLNGLTKHGLEAIAISADGADMDLNEAKKNVLNYKLTTEDFRYVLHQVPQSPNAEKSFVLKDNYYFFPIQTVRLKENKNLVQNIGWGSGSFDPTMH